MLWKIIDALNLMPGPAKANIGRSNGADRQSPGRLSQPLGGEA